MGRRELCPCCLNYVTQGQLKKHADETARRQSILAMGGNPDIRNVPLRIKPITGNDIFPPQAPAPAPPTDDNAFDTEAFVDSPPQPPPLPRVIPSHSINDNDFPPDIADSSNTPPPASKFPEYPLVEMSDGEEDENETGDQGKHGTEEAQREARLDEFMDFEYLKQGESRLHIGVGVLS